LREPTLNGTKEAAPPPLATTRHPAKKFSFPFRRKNTAHTHQEKRRKLFCGVLLSTSRAAGLTSFSIRSGAAEFPPKPPSFLPACLKNARSD